MSQQNLPKWSRRRVLASTASVAGGVLLTGCTGAGTGDPAGAAARAPRTGPVPATEDLMYEHGLLKRVLLVYDAAIGRIESDDAVPSASLREAATVVRSLIHDHHERLEERFVFSPLLDAGRYADTVGILIAQHAGGRRLTGQILEQTAQNDLTQDARGQLASAMGEFVRMYAPHEAREDTVIFPALRDVVPPQEFADLGERFADDERRRFGDNGFTEMTERVAAVENTLGIHDLNQFTPRSA